MRKMDFRNVVTAIVGAVMNRSVLLMMNPFGIAYFASAYMYKPGRTGVGGCNRQPEWRRQCRREYCLNILVCFLGSCS